MPELPEVETVRRVLEPELSGRVIEDLVVRDPGVIAHPSPCSFAGVLAGQSFSSLCRRGKFLIAAMESGDRIVCHLRMTGSLQLLRADVPEEKHTRAVFRLDNGYSLRFTDTRRFGRLWLLQDGEEDHITGISSLGPEPDWPEFSAAYLRARCGRSRRSVKQCLLDQSVVAGIGNIYSDEILFSSHILPMRQACSLSEGEWETLAAEIPLRLSFFVEKNAISLDEYQKSGGREYRNTPFLLVYGHEGEPCPVCGTKLSRSVIGGRSSTYCTCCQH